MKKSTKFLSLLLAVIMVFSVIPMTAFASPIKNSSTVDDLIKNENLADVVEYLLTKINDRKTAITGTVLRLVFSFLTDNEDLQKEIGEKDVFALTDAEAAKALLDWLDNTILPDLQAKLDSNDTVKDILNTLNAVTPITVKVNSVDNLFKTLTDDVPILGTIKTLTFGAVSAGDLNSLNVNALNTKRANGDLNVVYAFLQFIADNTSLVKKALTGNLDLGLLNNRIDALDNILNLITELPSFIKSALYKLIDKDAEMGKFEKDQMGGAWAASPYNKHTADELLGAALIKAINGTDDVVSKTDAGAVTKKSFYDLLADYAEPVFNKFALDPLNELITKLNSWLAEQTNAELKALFKAPIAPLTAATFNSIFADAKSTGLLEQLNNILLAALKHIFADKVYNAAKLTAGGNENLNANLTKIARYALPILVKLEDMMGYTFPDEIKNADPEKLSLADMATYILKPFFESWFGDSDNFNKAVVNGAASLPALAVLAVNYTATNKEWLNLDYDFGTVTANDIKNIKEDAATKKVMATAAGIAIGALKYNAEKIHFTATVTGTDWVADFNAIENWGLDFIKGLPALVSTHNLKTQNGYGAFYKLNVVLNELIDFSFLNDVNSATFKFDVEKLLTSLCAKLYNFDLAGIVHIFEKNSKSGNVLGGSLNTSVIGMVDRILTALFEHTCGTHGTATETEDDPAAPCTKQIKKEYEYCTKCGAFFSYKPTTVTKTRATHVYGAKTTEKSKPNDKLIGKATCNYQTRTKEVCTICGDVKYSTWTTAKHTLNKDKTQCTVCGYKFSTDPVTPPDGPQEPEVPTYMLGDVNNDKNVNTSDARLALRKAIGLEKYQEGSPEFIACDVTKDNKVGTDDARYILRHAIGLTDAQIAW